jgi:hypothetical protein
MSLSGSSAQFDRGPETPWATDLGRGVGGGTVYRVTAPEGEEGGVNYAPGAEVRVSGASTTYDHFDQASAEQVDSHGDLARYQLGDGPDNQGALFGVMHRNPHVSWMSSHRDYRAHIPTLLGIAAVETKARYGESLRSDTSLSETSSPIVHRLAQAGAVEAPAMEFRNNEYHDPEKWVRTRVGQNPREIPESTVNTSKQFLRQALRRPRQAVQRGAAAAGDKKFHQPEMFK